MGAVVRGAGDDGADDIVADAPGRIPSRPVLAPGYEADDALATLATQAAAASEAVVILSSDKDLLQLIGPGVAVERIGRTIRDLDRWDGERFAAEYAFGPALLADYKALCGDKSDNIPGVPGVGPVAAQRPIQWHGDLDGIMARAQSEKPALARKLTEHRDAAFLYRQLTTLIRAVPGVSLGPARAMVTR